MFHTGQLVQWSADLSRSGFLPISHSRPIGWDQCFSVAAAQAFGDKSMQDNKQRGAKENDPERELRANIRLPERYALNTRCGPPTRHEPLLCEPSEPLMAR
jgi:hypothetical protein